MDDSNLTRLSITVEETSVIRCIWCGKVLSIEWTIQPHNPISQSESGPRVCSESCRLAAGSEINPACAYGLLVPTSFLIIFGIFTPGLLLIAGVIGGPAVFCLLLRYAGNEEAKVNPKDSCRTDISDEGLLLQSIPHEVECPTCDANLDLTGLGPERLFRCEYCGASGIVEIKYHQ